MQKGRSIKGYWPLAVFTLSLVLAFVMLSPVLSSGFIGDDIAVSAGYSRSALRVAGSSVAETYAGFLGDAMRNGLKGGRIFPLSALSGLPVTLADGEPAGYKVYVVILVMVNILLFGYLVYRVAGSRTITLLTLTMLPLTFQLRSELYDPILGFAGLLPAVSVLVFGSLVLLVVYLDTGKRLYAVLSAIVYGLALLTYEIAIMFCVLHLIVVWLYPARRSLVRALRQTAPFLLLAAASASAAFVVRLVNGVPVFAKNGAYLTHVGLGADPSEGAYALSLSAGPVFSTLAKQIVAALPMSYPLLDATTKARLSEATLTSARALSVFVSLGLMVAIAVLAWRAWSGRGREATRAGTPVAWILAGALVVLPNVLIALSPRYQTEITWGVSHLPVFISYFGVALLLALLVEAFLRWSARWKIGPVAFAAIVAVLAVALGYCGGATYTNNRVEVAHANLGTLYPREIVTVAAERGAFDLLPADATLSVTEAHPWDTVAFYSGLLGRPVTCVPVESPEVTGEDSVSPPAEADPDASGEGYWLYYGAYGRGNGFALLGRQISIDENERSIILADVRLYLDAEQSSELADLDRFALADTSLAQLSLDPGMFMQVSGGADWALYELIPGEEFGMYY